MSRGAAGFLLTCLVVVLACGAVVSAQWFDPEELVKTEKGE